MGDYWRDYRHGRIITPEVTSKSDKSWSTKWHRTPSSAQTGPAIEQVCYNSGTDPSKSQNNKWCSSISSGDGVIPCFTVSGCPDLIVYEVTTHESTSMGFYSEYFGGSNRNKIIERKQYFEDYPLDNTGHLYVQYTGSANYSGDCGCKHHVLNWTFPPYDHGKSSISGCDNFCREDAMGFGICCQMGAVMGDGGDVRSFTPNVGQTAQSLGFSGCLEWNSADPSTGWLDFVWSGQTPTGLGSYQRSAGGNTAGVGDGTTQYKGVGAADRGSEVANLIGDTNEWDIRIVKNAATGLGASGSHSYTTHYLSGNSGILTFTRTLKDNYLNIRTDSNRTLINLSDYVAPSARYTTDAGRYRKVSLYAAYQTSFIFAVNAVTRTDSYTGIYSAGGKGFNSDKATTDLWCHQSGINEPFSIYNGWGNTCDYSLVAGTSGDCFALAVSGSMGWDDFNESSCSCEPLDVTTERQSAAGDVTYYDEYRGGATPTYLGRGTRYLDLSFIMESGDQLYYEGWEESGWNSYCHGHFLAVNQSSGNWENFTGCAEISSFQTFVNGQEV